MIVTTTDGVEGRTIERYLGIVSSESIMGANIIKDMFASIRDVVGGRAKAYEETLQDAKNAAMEDLNARAVELGADAVVGIDLDYEAIGQRGSMLMVSVNGTAVKLS